MDNHVHLLAVPEKENALARGIGLTNQVYTQYLNRKLNQSGRIWQNRFFSCIVENDEYHPHPPRYRRGLWCGLKSLLSLPRHANHPHGHRLRRLDRHRLHRHRYPWDRHLRRSRQFRADVFSVGADFFSGGVEVLFGVKFWNIKFL